MSQEYQDFKDEISKEFRLRIWQALYYLLKESNLLMINRQDYGDTLEMILISRQKDYFASYET